MTTIGKHRPTVAMIVGGIVLVTSTALGQERLACGTGLAQVEVEYVRVLIGADVAAGTNPNAVYNTNMDSDACGGISFDAGATGVGDVLAEAERRLAREKEIPRLGARIIGIRRMYS